MRPDAPAALGWGMTEPASTTNTRLRELLERTKTIAVLGASGRDGRPANYVPAYLSERGYEILPVSPRWRGQELFGRETVAALGDLEQEVDLVDVFRRSEDLPAHLPELLAMRPLPKAVWFQLGIRNDDVADALRAAGVDVVQDRCIMVDHRQLMGVADAARGA